MTKRISNLGSSSDKEQTTVRSALRALDLLECFTAANPERNLSELSKETGLAVSTTSRMLATLVSAGYLKKTGSGSYAFDSRILKIAVAGLESHSLYDIVGSRLKALRDRTGETANFAIPNGRKTAIYVRQAESLQPIQHKVWLGETIPLKDTAIGEAILGKLGADGFAMRFGSIEPDVVAVAAPIRDGTGKIVGALSITMPRYRATKDIAADYGNLVRIHADEVSSELTGQTLRLG